MRLPMSWSSLRRSTRKPRWLAIFDFTQAHHLWFLVPAVIVTACSASVGPAAGVFIGRFGDAVAQFGGGLIDSATLRERTKPTVNAFITLGCVSLVLSAMMYASWTGFGEMQAKRVREDLFRNLLEKDLDWFEARESSVASVLTRLQTQIRELQLGASQSLAFAIHGLIEGLVAFGLAMYYNWRVTLVVISGLPFAGLLLQVTSNRMQQHIHAQHAALARAASTANFSITNISLVKCFNSQTKQTSQYTACINSAAVFALNQATLAAVQLGTLTVLLMVMFMIGLWYGGKLIHDGDTSTGKIITSMWTAFTSLNAFQSIPTHILAIAKGHAAAVALRDLISVVERGKQSPKILDGSLPEFCSGRVEMHEVSFSYPSRPDHLVLHPASIVFDAGSITFLVGRSGSGKSTISNLLTRFHRPSSGHISIDGRNTSTLSLDWLRNNVTLVQQQSFLFNETIFTNIALGHRRHEQVTSDQIRACVKFASLESTISGLPYGIDTKVGASGKALSGGQVQRIAIARARLRNTPVLILDESTSALDSTNRTVIMGNLRAWRAGLTTIIITHDTSQIQENDHVYMLEDGYVLRQGRRDNVLLQQSPKPPDKTREQGATQASPAGCARNVSRRRPAGIRWTKQVSERRGSFERRLEDLGTGTYLKSPDNFGRASRITMLLVGNIPMVSSSLHGSKVIPPQQALKHTAQAAPPLPELPRSVKPASQDHQLENLPTPASSSARMASLMAGRSTAQPSPRLLDDSSRKIRARFGGPSFQSIDDGEPKQMSLQKIFATLPPTLSKAHRIWASIGVAASCCRAALPSVTSYCISKILETYYMVNEFESKVLKWCMILLCVAITEGGLAYVGSYLMDAVARRWADRLRAMAMRQILQQPKAWFDEPDNSAGFLTSVLDKNAEEMRTLVSRHTTTLLNVVIMLSVAVIWSFVLAWKLTLVGLAAAPIIIGLVKSMDSSAAYWEAKMNTATDAIGSVFTETFTDIRTVRSLTLEGYFHRKYAQATSSAFVVGRNRAVYMGVLFGLCESTIQFLMAVLMWYAVRLATSYEVEAVQIFTSMSLMLLTATQAGSALSLVPLMAMATESAIRVMRLTRLKLPKNREWKNSPDANEGSRTCKVASVTHAVRFKGVKFAYPSRPHQLVLNDLHLTLPTGKVTALVGQSGSGKSTVASLLFNLYSVGTPTSIHLFNKPLPHIHPAELTSLIALVPQDPVLLPSASVWDNITYGLEPHTSPTTKQNVELAAKRAAIHDFVLTLPEGYETVVSDGEGGGGLGISGGQRQRIAIARALVRRSRVLVLDEALSALDRVSANEVRGGVRATMRDSADGQGGLRAKGEGKAKAVDEMTVLVITHDVETMKWADKVVMMEDGKVVEEGGFEELMDMGEAGRFRAMVLGG